MVVIPDKTCAHTVWIFSGRPGTGSVYRTQPVTRDTTAVVPADVDSAEHINLAILLLRTQTLLMAPGDNPEEPYKQIYGPTGPALHRRP